MNNLYIQKRLKKTNGDLTKLESKFGISATHHPTDSRVILNYDQIRSRKFNLMVQECRGLVLDKKDWSIVAKGFNRFYNLGECRANDNKFDWSHSFINTKEDGSLLLFYSYQNAYHVNTRSTFGDGKYNGIAWRGLFNQAVKDTSVYLLPPEYTYVFELCSRYNKVVRDYPKPTVYLLSVFDKNGCEKSHDDVDCIAGVYGILRPQTVTLKSIDVCVKYVESLGESDHTFEGVVLRDAQNVRIKLKSLNYIKLHRLCNNGLGFTVKNLIPVILMGETDEILVYFPEQKEKVLRLQSRLAEDLRNLTLYYENVKEIKSQKEFALEVTKNKYNSLLFSARKLNCTIDKLWTSENIFKYYQNWENESD